MSGDTRPWDHRFPVPDPSPHLPNYHDEISVCSHGGPFSRPETLCQGGCGRAICGLCRYESTRRYVCMTCYYRIDAWREIERRLTVPDTQSGTNAIQTGTTEG